MNGGGDVTAAPISNNSHRSTGSKKRKRGLAPRRTAQSTTVTAIDVAVKAGVKSSSNKVDQLQSNGTLQNGHRSHVVKEQQKPNGSKDAISTGSTVCNLCGIDKADSMLNLSNNDKMRDTLITFWKVPQRKAENTLSWICVQCVFKINAHLDETRSLEIRLHRLTNGQIHRTAPQAHEEKTDLVQSRESIINKCENISMQSAPLALKQIKSSLRRKCRKEEQNNLLTEVVPRVKNITDDPVVQTPGIVDAHESTHPLVTLNNNSTTSLPCKLPKETRDKSSSSTSINLLDGSITPPLYSPHHGHNENAFRAPPSKSKTDNELKVSVLRKPPSNSKIDIGLQEVSYLDLHKKKSYVVQVEEITPVRSSRNAKEEVASNPILSPSYAALTKYSSFSQPSETTEHLVTAIMTNAPSRSNSPLQIGESESAHNSSMLEIYCERSESALITESGGKINNYSRSKHVPTQLSCQHCNRAYWRKDFYARHIRRCAARLRVKLGTKIKSVGINANADASVCNMNVVDVSENDAAEYQTEQCRPRRFFHCSECAVTVDSMTKLRLHKRIHFQRFYCVICRNELTTKHEYDFHRAVCEAEQAAQYVAKPPEILECFSNIATVVPATAATPVRMTRARSRALSSVASKVTRINTTFSNEESDDDDASVADTMYTKRMRFTGNWVEDQSNSNSYLSLCEKNLNDYDDDMQSRTYKEYDLYLLNRLKEDILSDVFTCYAPFCNYQTDTLVKILLHDYINHFKSSWFYCKKCGRVFTSKVFLDYHLDRQNGGRFICNKCGDIFEFQHQLDRHLIRHTKCINYRCNYCNFEFLTENELLQHCEIEQHDPNGERKCIRVDPTLKIVNKVPPLETSRRGAYLVKIIDMHLPQLPRRSPMDLRMLKPHRRLIGDVEFKNQKNPNCWGWK